MSYFKDIYSEIDRAAEFQGFEVWNIAGLYWKFPIWIEYSKTKQSPLGKKRGGS